MSTLNNIIQYGQQSTLQLKKVTKYVSTYTNKYFKHIDYDNLYIYIIIFFIYISITLIKISSSTNQEELNKQKGSSILNDPYVIIILVSYAISFISNMISGYSPSFIHFGIMTYILYSYFNTLFNDKSDPNKIDSEGNEPYTGFMHYISFTYVKTQGQLVKFFSILITVIFTLGYLSLFKTMNGVVPDVYFIGIMFISLPLFILSPIGRDNISDFFKDKLYYIFTLLIILSMSYNISKYSIRTINVMNILMISSIIIIMISGFKIIHDPNITKTFLSTTEKQKVNSKNYESIDYVFDIDNTSSTDCNYYENKNGSLIDSCKINNKSYDIRKNKIINNNNGFSEIHSFKGPIFIFLLLQLILAVLCFGSIKLFLSKYPNPPKLFTKFIIYIIIINSTVFYFNILVKQYNIFGLRNTLYGNSESCLIVDKNSSNIDNYYGDYIDNLSDRYTCINDKKLIKSGKTTTWKDLFIYFYDPNNDKIQSDIIKNGIYITIYSLLIFLIMYLCDYLSYWKEINSLKFVCLLISLIIIIVYVIVRNIDSNIDIIKNNKYNDKIPKLYTIDDDKSIDDKS